jgi:imidazolonepropionase-like amidohydrolase
VKKLQQGATDRPDLQKAYGIQARNLAKIHAAGIKIVLGTDGGVPWSHHVEMEDMVAAGMTPSDVIVASTKNAAEFLRMDNAGTVAAGKRADFIVLDANPLDNLANARKISRVYLRGQEIDRAALRTEFRSRR